MKCHICKQGEVRNGHVTITEVVGATTVVIHKVPADVCDTCGEYYLDVSTAEAVASRVRDANARGSLIEVCDYASIGSTLVGAE